MYFLRGGNGSNVCEKRRGNNEGNADGDGVKGRKRK